MATKKAAPKKVAKKSSENVSAPSMHWLENQR
jgi:hypothetical protein